MFFSYNLPTGTSFSLFSVKKFCVKILFCRHYFNPLNTFVRKGKDPDPSLTNGSGSGSPTLVIILILLLVSPYYRIGVRMGGRLPFLRA
jgi:hypothetical protein